MTKPFFLQTFPCPFSIYLCSRTLVHLFICGLHILIAKGKANRNVDLLDLTDLTDLEDTRITSEPRIKRKFPFSSVVTEAWIYDMLPFLAEPSFLDGGKW